MKREIIAEFAQQGGEFLSTLKNTDEYWETIKLRIID